MLKKEYEYYSTWMNEYRLSSLDWSPQIERPENLPLVDILAAACKITWKDVFELRRAYCKCPSQFETIDAYVFKCESEAAAKFIIKDRWAIANGMLFGGVLSDWEDEVLKTIEKTEKRYFKETKTVMRKPTYGTKNNLDYYYEVEEMESYIEMVKGRPGESAFLTTGGGSEDLINGSGQKNFHKWALSAVLNCSVSEY